MKLCNCHYLYLLKNTTAWTLGFCVSFTKQETQIFNAWKVYLRTTKSFKFSYKNTKTILLQNLFCIYAENTEPRKKGKILMHSIKKKILMEAPAKCLTVLVSYLFIWNSNLTGCPVFSLITLLDTPSSQKMAPNSFSTERGLYLVTHFWHIEERAGDAVRPLILGDKKHVASLTLILLGLFSGRSQLPCGEEAPAALWRGPCSRELRPSANSRVSKLGTGNLLLQSSL